MLDVTYNLFSKQLAKYDIPSNIVFLVADLCLWEEVCVSPFS